MKRILAVLLFMAVAFVAVATPREDRRAARLAKKAPVTVEKFGTVYHFRDSATLKTFLDLYDRKVQNSEAIEKLNNIQELMDPIRDLLNRIQMDIFSHTVREFDVQDLSNKFLDLKYYTYSIEVSDEKATSTLEHSKTKLDKICDRLRYGGWDDFYMNIDDYFNKIQDDLQDFQSLIVEAAMLTVQASNDTDAEFANFVAKKNIK